MLFTSNVKACSITLKANLFGQEYARMSEITDLTRQGLMCEGGRPPSHCSKQGETIEGGMTSVFLSGRVHEKFITEKQNQS